jgi:hypothetical protein
MEISNVLNTAQLEARSSFIVEEQITLPVLTKRNKLGEQHKRMLHGLIVVSGCAVMLIFIGMFLRGLGKPQGVVFIGIALFFLLYSVMVATVGVKVNNKRAFDYNYGLDGGNQFWRTLVIDDVGIMIIIPSTVTVFAWTDIVKFRITDEYIVGDTRNKLAIPLLKSGFKEGYAEDFIPYLQVNHPSIKIEKA